MDWITAARTYQPQLAERKLARAFELILRPQIREFTEDPLKTVFVVGTYSMQTALWRLHAVLHAFESESLVVHQENLPDDSTKIWISKNPYKPIMLN